MALLPRRPALPPPEELWPEEAPPSAIPENLSKYLYSSWSPLRTLAAPGADCLVGPVLSGPTVAPQPAMEPTAVVPPASTAGSSAPTAIVPYQASPIKTPPPSSSSASPPCPKMVVVPPSIDPAVNSRRWAAILAADPHFAQFIRPLHEDLSTALTTYAAPQGSSGLALVPTSRQQCDSPTPSSSSSSCTAIVQSPPRRCGRTPQGGKEGGEQQQLGMTRRRAGGLDELIAFAEALCSGYAERGNLMVDGVSGAGDVPPPDKTVRMDLRMEVKTQGLGGGGPAGRGKRGGGNNHVSVGAKVKAYSPQLMREYPLAVEGEDGREVSLAGPALRRAPLILVELCDACLEQAVTRFFRLYEELWDLRTPPYERPTLFIFADLASESKLSHHQQLDLLRKIAALLKQLEMEGKPAHREAASRVFFNDPNAHIKGLSLSSSNDLILSTIRRSSVCGLNFLRCMTGRDVLRLCRYKVGAADEGEEGRIMPDGQQSAVDNHEEEEEGGGVQGKKGAGRSTRTHASAGQELAEAGVVKQGAKPRLASRGLEAKAASSGRRRGKGELAS